MSIPTPDRGILTIGIELPMFTGCTDCKFAEEVRTGSSVTGSDEAPVMLGDVPAFHRPRIRQTHLMRYRVGPALRRAAHHPRVRFLCSSLQKTRHSRRLGRTSGGQLPLHHPERDRRVFLLPARNRVPNVLRIQHPDRCRQSCRKAIYRPRSSAVCSCSSSGVRRCFSPIGIFFYFIRSTPVSKDIVYGRK